PPPPPPPFLIFHIHTTDSPMTSCLVGSDMCIRDSCKEYMGWDIFFDRDYLLAENKLAVKWTDRDIMDVYSKAFKSTINLFEKLVVNNKLTLRDTSGWVIVNPTFERQFEWIESEVFEIVGTHLGYNVDAIRKQMVTACKMTFN
uniref:hypothetical protein n=1 Tax=Enterobacter chengduensis TaxID=2494701 RepID=UPI003D6F8ABC